MPAINSSQFDPLCRAVRRLVDRGIFVVAAAGNNGKDSSGQKVYGQVHSPGNEASALTVGAVDTQGTDSRGDDTIATYSSRGPTRSFWTDEFGVKHFDNIIKPELSAPGNKTIFAESPGNFILSQNPSLDAGVSGNDTRKQMILSGTSMAAPLAAGAAALLFEANPTLSPNLIKAILMYTAQQLPNYNMFEQGAGELNVDGAVRVARAAQRSAHSGAALAGALVRIADDLRNDIALANEAAARRAGVLVVLPLGLCFLPAFVLTGLVPVIVAVIGGVLSASH